LCGLSGLFLHAKPKMTYWTGISVFNRITDEKQWLAFLIAVYEYFKNMKDVEMTVHINIDTGELLTPLSATEIKQLHLTDQFNFIEGDTSRFLHWHVNLAENLYEKSIYQLNDVEKAHVYIESLKKVQVTNNRMNYSFSEAELTELVQKTQLEELQGRQIPPVALQVGRILLPRYAHHFNVTEGQLWKEHKTDWIMKNIYNIIQRYIPENESYYYWHEINDDNPYSLPFYYIYKNKYQKRITSETREENDAFYQKLLDKAH
jgi:hypothetical protein